MKLGDREVKEFSNPYVIAEIGANHNGDMDLARRLIDSAKACGCDAVKFQSWTPDSLISKEEYDRNQKYNDSPKKHFGSLREMVERYYLRPEQHAELKQYCDKSDIEFCSTAFSSDEVDILEEIGVPFFKIASMDINNLNLLRCIAGKNKPILMSTGMATIGEIDKAVRTVENTGNRDIILLHCISVYPPAYEDIHLNNISMLRQTFGYPVGFSDHTLGIYISLAAVALGSCVIEKHFTIDKNLEGWDHEISADPKEMKAFVKAAKNIVKALGSHRRLVSEAEHQKKLKFRRSIVSSKELKKGHVIVTTDLLFKRPGTGIRPDEVQYLIGRILKRNVSSDQLIDWADLE